MIIQDIQLFYIQIPLKIRFSQSNNSTAVSDSLIVRLRTEGGITGYGECCPRTYVTGENSASVRRDIAIMVKRLKEQNLVSMTVIRQLFLGDLFQDMGLAAICGLELAVLDAWSKTYQQPILTALSEDTVAKPLHYSGVFPLTSIETLTILLEKYQQFEFKDIKLKIGTDLADTIAKLALIRHYFGTKTNIRVDVNTSWNLDVARQQIPILLEEGVDTFEQIFPAHCLYDLQIIHSEFGKRANIMVDEAITSMKQAEFLTQHRICNHFNLKISKHGGIFRTLQIYEWIIQYGLKCQLGAHFGETSILTAAGTIVATLAEQLSNQEGAFGTYLLKEDICERPLMFGKDARLLPDLLKKETLGWGLCVVEERLKRFADRED